MIIIIIIIIIKMCHVNLKYVLGTCLGIFTFRT